MWGSTEIKNQSLNQPAKIFLLRPLRTPTTPTMIVSSYLSTLPESVDSMPLIDFHLEWDI